MGISNNGVRWARGTSNYPMININTYIYIFIIVYIYISGQISSRLHEPTGFPSKGSWSEGISPYYNLTRYILYFYICSIYLIHVGISKQGADAYF